VSVHVILPRSRPPQRLYPAGAMAAIEATHLFSPRRSENSSGTKTQGKLQRPLYTSNSAHRLPNSNRPYHRAAIHAVDSSLRAPAPLRGWERCVSAYSATPRARGAYCSLYFPTSSPWARMCPSTARKNTSLPAAIQGSVPSSRAASSTASRSSFVSRA
jgi:hypothetical protein